MNGWLLPIVVAAVGMFFSMCVGYYRMSQQVEEYMDKNIALSAQLGYVETALKILKEQNETMMASLAEREKQLDLLRKERETIRKNFQKVVQDDKTSRDWSTITVPDRVRELLTNSGTGSSETDAADISMCPR